MNSVHSCVSCAKRGWGNCKWESWKQRSTDLAILWIIQLTECNFESLQYALPDVLQEGYCLLIAFAVPRGTRAGRFVGYNPRLGRSIGWRLLPRPKS